MRVSAAEATTENAASYTRKLCAHWSHKFAVTVEGDHGTIELPAAKCELQASQTMLTVRLQLQEDADEERMRRCWKSICNGSLFARNWCLRGTLSVEPNTL